MKPFEILKTNIITSTVVLLCIFSAVSAARTGKSKTDKLSYLDPKLPIEKRIDDLLGRMTLKEKIGQMCQFSGYADDSKQLVEKGGVGSFLNITSPEIINDLQKRAMTEARLKIPILFGLDVIHGYATTFPIPLAEASTWNPNLVEKCAEAAAREASSQGIRWTFSPMVDIARDPRWGRIAEGSGEDPYLDMAMGKAKVQGYQGHELSPQSSLVACAKHYVAYGGAEGGRDYNTVDISERTLREVYLPPFRATVDAGVGTVMSAFNDLNGIPATANSFTIKDILKNQWGFKGFVVSDWDAVAELINHGVAGDSAEATVKAVNAGVDMDMVGPYHDNLEPLVKSGKVSRKVIDDAVRRILRIKFELGLFENPYVDVGKAKSSLFLQEYKSLALDEARQSIVLLKNENKTLPLRKDVKSVAVIGPLAESKADMLGCWHCMGRADSAVTILDGIKKKVAAGTRIIYARGCGVNDTSTAGFAEAINAASRADVVIMVVGESGNMSGEAESRSTLDIPGVQEKLVREISALGKPVVEVLLNGRPLSISWSAEHVPAIVDAWFLGIESGGAVADVLFGDYNPGGKLPATFPRTVGQVPIYYSHMNTGRPATSEHFTSKYIDLPSTPLYPFGFGLSYTNFKYSNLTVTKNPKLPDCFNVSVDVTNSGAMAGDEVVQLYIHQKDASVTRPVKELQGFKRISLAAGETKKVEFTLTAYNFSFINSEMKRVVEAGEIDIMVGGNSEELVSTTVNLDKSMTVSEKTPDENGN
jgi:beta-glucosidase